MGFNSAFKGLTGEHIFKTQQVRYNIWKVPTWIILHAPN